MLKKKAMRPKRRGDYVALTQFVTSHSLKYEGSMKMWDEVERGGTMSGPEEILTFWLDEVGPQGWFGGSAALDDEVRARFAETLDGIGAGRFSLWLTYPSGSLAYVIAADQFSRHIYRNTPRAFAFDRIALAAAKSAIDKGWDLKIDESARRFFYMPMMHSENLCDQDRCVRLMHERLPEHGALPLLHARAHRAVIRRFGRFPARNAALSRVSTNLETEYVGSSGYEEILRELQEAQAA